MLSVLFVLFVVRNMPFLFFVLLVVGNMLSASLR